MSTETDTQTIPAPMPKADPREATTATHKHPDLRSHFVTSNQVLEEFSPGAREPRHEP